MSSAMGYDGGLTCAMNVKDRKASTKWFESVLGFKLLYDVAEIGWCELATPVARVNLGLSEVESPTPGGRGVVMTLGVKDIETARAHLERNKVRFDGPTREYPGMVKLATFFDPEGNTFMLYQDLAQK